MEFSRIERAPEQNSLHYTIENLTSGWLYKHIESKRVFPKHVYIQVKYAYVNKLSFPFILNYHITKTIISSTAL